MKISTSLSLIFFSIIVFTSCKKQDALIPTTPPPTPYSPSPHIYIGGAVNGIGTIWKKSLVRLSLSDFTQDSLPGAGVINTIITSGNDIFMSSAGAAGYWKNGSLISLPGARSVEWITLSNNEVYALGYDNDIARNFVYWKGNNKVILQNPADKQKFPNIGSYSYNLSGIAVSGSNVFACGNFSYMDEPPIGTTSGNYALLWSPSGLKYLGPGTLLSIYFEGAVGVSTQGNDVYLAGNFPDRPSAGGYWKNGDFNPINNGNFVPSSISTINDSVYIPGYTFTRTATSYSQQAAYWVNGNIVTLDGNQAIAIAINGPDKYVLGIDNANQYVVWKNGTRYLDIGNTLNNFAYALAIGN